MAAAAWRYDRNGHRLPEYHEISAEPAVAAHDGRTGRRAVRGRGSLERHRREFARHIRARAVRVLFAALPADSSDRTRARQRAGLRRSPVLHDLLFLSEGLRR